MKISLFTGSDLECILLITDSVVLHAVESRVGALGVFLATHLYQRTIKEL